MEVTVAIAPHPNALMLRCILNCVDANLHYVFATIFIWDSDLKMSNVMVVAPEFPVCILSFREYKMGVLGQLHTLGLHHTSI